MLDHPNILIAAIIVTSAFAFAAVCAVNWHNAAKAAEHWRDTARAAVSEREDEMQRAERMQARLIDAIQTQSLLRGALDFYARDTHWRPMRTRRHSITFRDRGAVARAALRGEDIDQIMQQLHLAQTAPVVVSTPDTAPAGPDAGVTSGAEQAAA